MMSMARGLAYAKAYCVLKNWSKEEEGRKKFSLQASSKNGGKREKKEKLSANKMKTDERES